MRKFTLFTFFNLLSLYLSAQHFTATDTLRGSNHELRKNWNVLKYELTIEPNFQEKTIQGINEITYFEETMSKLIQIDLQEPMILDSVKQGDALLSFSKDGARYIIMVYDTAADLHYRVPPGIRSLKLFFHGQPTIAKRAPWDGGWVWQKDAAGNPWVSVACQSNGASLWFPCKDYMGDKADSGVVMHLITPQNLIGIGNGRLISTQSLNNGKVQYTWEVKSSISSYNIIPYFGRYQHFSDTLHGLNGVLDLNYYVLPENFSKAQQQFKQTKSVIHGMEYWAGPYPFYQDGFKLVEAPYLGMEHQSNVAYGNGYTNGYKGMDLSKTGVGLKWDFIIMHEGAHEWFGNAITASDIAYLWIHEGFTTYAEVLYSDYLLGEEAGKKYLTGTYNRILNKDPIEGHPDVHHEGDGDMYPKGAALVHILRHLLPKDKSFREVQKNMIQTFKDTTITSKDLLAFWNKESGRDLSPIFRQYLQTTMVPTLEWKKTSKGVKYRWTNCVDGFDLPLIVMDGKKKQHTIYPSGSWQTNKKVKKSINVMNDFYIKTKIAD